VIFLIFLWVGLTLVLGQPDRVEATPAQQNAPGWPEAMVSELAMKDVLPPQPEAEPIPHQPPKAALPAPQQGPPPQAGGIGYLSGPAAGDPLDIALNYIHQNKSALGLTDADLADLVVKDRYVSRHNGVTHIYLRQRFDGLEVFNGDININIDREGRVINLGNRFVSDLKNSVNTTVASLSAVEAVNGAARSLSLTITEPIVPRRTLGGRANEVILSNGGISLEDIPVKLMYQPQRTGTRLSWNMVIRLKNGQNWWNLRVDAVTGEVLSQNDWIANDTYRVFASPKESPSDGPRTSVVNPANALASPFGWHDTNGAAGADFTDTRGNNVFAQDDLDANDTGGSRPNGGAGLVFSNTLNLTLAPSTYLSASITNLFYWNNLLHDLHYQYGFDEASGNFQQNSYGRGGLDNDPVQADAQDGSSTNNANFGTPPDGLDPRMQMFVWTFTTPNRDSALDNGIIIHEYGHGVSTRLTGGPSNVNCLFGAQSGGMGEGWSDWWTLAFTAVATDTGPTARSVGTYSLGQPPDGPGIRPFPYSTDFGINPHTYGNINGLAVPHGVGSVWAVTLWEMYWNLIDAYGFDPNFYTGSGGNNLALQLVMDGLKLQPCNPTFVEARDAILTADLVNNGGVNQCLIWEAFAKRGLGLSAVDGGNHNSLAVAENFDLPPLCLDELALTKHANPEPARVGKVLNYTLVAGNYTTATLTSMTLTDTVPLSTTYVSGSASDGGSESGGVVQWAIGTMPPDTVVTRTFQVVVNPNFDINPVTLFYDNVENGGGNWTATGLWHLEDDNDACGNSFSPTTSWYYGQSPGCTYNTGAANSGRLTTVAPIALPASLGQINLTFRSWEDTENITGFDTRQVLVSTNGANFTSVFRSTNDDADWYEAVVDLSAYAGQNIWLRFEFNTVDNVFNNFPGWYVDDIRLIGQPTIVNTAHVTSSQGETDSVTINTPVIRAAELAYTPTSLEEFLAPGQIVTRTLIISNVGTASLDFLLSEAPGSAPNAITLAHQPGGLDQPGPNLNAASGWGEVFAPPAIQWLGQTNSAAGFLPIIINDPANDAGGIDVTTIAAASTTSEISMRLTFNSGLGPTGAVGYIHLDTDQNAATGLPPSMLFGLPEQDIGFDYYLSLFNLPQRVDVFDFNNTYIGSVAPIQTADALEFTLPLSFLGQDDGFMDVTMILGDFFAPTDWAPDAGHGSIFDARWLSEAPSFGTVMPENSQLVEIIFNSNLISQTGTYSAQLHFDGNMANSVAPLPVIMHVGVLPTQTDIYLPLIVKDY
jgi:extracellular elastinolytic metalloproteinase